MQMLKRPFAYVVRPISRFGPDSFPHPFAWRTGSNRAHVLCTLTNPAYSLMIALHTLTSSWYPTAWFQSLEDTVSELKNAVSEMVSAG